MLHRSALIPGVMLGASALVLTACGSTGGSSDGTLDRLREAGVAKVAVAKGPPLSDLDGDGHPTGYIPAVAGEVLSELGVDELDGVATDFEGMIPGLQANRWDLVTSGMDITAERCEVIVFSEPLTAQRETLTVRSDDGDRLASYADVAADPSVTVAAIAGSSQQRYATETGGVDNDQILPVKDHRTGIDALHSGRVDGVLLGEFSVQKVVTEAEKQSLRTNVLEEVPPTGTAVAFRASDRDLRDAFDDKLQEMRADGRLGDLYTEWGFDNRDDLEAVTREDLVPICG